MVTRQALDETLDGLVDRLLATTQGIPSVRTEIFASWRRSLAYGVAPDRLEVPIGAIYESQELLEKAAAPVLDRLSDDLVDSGVVLLLANRYAQIIDRRVPDPGLRRKLDGLVLVPGADYRERSVGTNAISLALVGPGPNQVIGSEHFSENLSYLACAAAPVIDPATRTVVGAMGLSCRASLANSLMIPFVKRATWEIERRLAVITATELTTPDSRRSVAGPHAFGWDALTKSEQKVVGLVAQGLTNRAVAERLFVSPYTVDSHLRNIFRKLDIGSRVELARIAVEHAQDEP
jgi:transcriptional regulator of acetoin/glycerol metabolism